MLTPEQRKGLIEKIRIVPSDLETAVIGLSDDQLDTPYRDGGWTIRQVVHHLAESHMNGFVRFKLALTEDSPILKAYDQEKWANLHDIQSAPIQSSMEILRGLHTRICSLLAGLKEDDWSRKAMHEERGEMTIDELLLLYANHGEKHMGHINKLKSDKGWN